MRFKVHALSSYVLQAQARIFLEFPAIQNYCFFSGGIDCCGCCIVAAEVTADDIPVTFTLLYETIEGLFVQLYLDVILLFGPGVIAAYLDVRTNFHVE